MCDFSMLRIVDVGEQTHPYPTSMEKMYAWMTNQQSDESYNFPSKTD